MKTQIENLYTTDCIRTFTGLYINVFSPTPEMICIEDIAHGLSNQCRFAGHLNKFYSVAQHSWHCYTLVSDEHKLAALLHDASEAYLCDMPKPIKKNLPDYCKIEDNLMKVISKKFGFEYPSSKEVKEADKTMLIVEWEKLMINATDHVCWDHAESKQTFIKTFEFIYKKNIQL